MNCCKLRITCITIIREQRDWTGKREMVSSSLIIRTKAKWVTWGLSAHLAGSSWTKWKEGIKVVSLT